MQREVNDMSAIKVSKSNFDFIVKKLSEKVNLFDKKRMKNEK